MTATQERFVEWNAARLGLTADESRRRYDESLGLFPGGHGGWDYRTWDLQCHRVLQVFHGDARGEVFESYQFYDPIHFLRFLSYRESEWTNPVEKMLLSSLTGRMAVRILDFGCGLAQGSRGLAGRLRTGGVDVSLTLVDIPTLRKDFLRWLSPEAAFLDCTREAPIPALPVCDVCLATEFFEHVREPVAYLEAIDGALTGGGLLLTNVANHVTEFFHVTPDLGVVRERLASLGYEVLSPDVLYRKAV